MVTAWLIERNDVHLCYSNGDTCFRWVTFSDPKAWRFDTKEAADAIIADHKLSNIRVVSHGWMEPENEDDERIARDAAWESDRLC